MEQQKNTYFKFDTINHCILYELRAGTQFKTRQLLRGHEKRFIVAIMYVILYCRSDSISVVRVQRNFVRRSVRRKGIPVHRIVPIILPLLLLKSTITAILTNKKKWIYSPLTSIMYVYVQYVWYTVQTHIYYICILKPHHSAHSSVAAFGR